MTPLESRIKPFHPLLTLQSRIKTFQPMPPLDSKIKLFIQCSHCNPGKNVFNQCFPFLSCFSYGSTQGRFIQRILPSRWCFTNEWAQFLQSFRADLLGDANKFFCLNFILRVYFVTLSIPENPSNWATLLWDKGRVFLCCVF